MKVVKMLLYLKKTQNTQTKHTNIKKIKMHKLQIAR